MTAIYYRDISATSDSGRFTVEARSSHNGTVPGRDGTIPVDAFGYKYRQHQREFRYQLLDHSEDGPVVVWERYQGRDEDSPHEVVVSDDGWVVLRTHGFDPEVIAVGVDGRDAIRVRVESAASNPAEETAPGPAWRLRQMVDSTAGRYWSPNSWRVFCRHQGRTVFAWSAWWGQRLILDLERSVAHTGEEPIPDGLETAVVAAEQAGVRAFLARLSGRMGEVRGRLAQPPKDRLDLRDELRDLIHWIPSALHLVGVHRMRDCIPYLRDWESAEQPAGRTGTSSMPDGWSLEDQYFRPTVHNALKHLGEEPVGFPTYGFVRGLGPDGERYPAPTLLPDRLERAGCLTRDLSAFEVLQRIGSPDFVRRESHKVGRFYIWTEDWEYDFRQGDGWTTLRITWEKPKRTPRIAAIGWVDPYWLDSNLREAEFLRF